MRKVIWSLICCISFMSAIVSCTEGPLEGENDSVNGGVTSGVGQESVHGPITMQLTSVTATTAVFAGSLDMETAMLYTELGIIYSTDPALSYDTGNRAPITSLVNTNEFTETISGLPYNTEIYYTSYFCTEAGLSVLGEIRSFKTLNIEEVTSNSIDLSLTADGQYVPANCYIVCTCGSYYFKATKGNSHDTMVGPSDVSVRVEVLWESFGTGVTPNKGELIKSVEYRNTYVMFQTSDTFKKGNAVIALKDTGDNVLWSWHIWFTDYPQEQEYYNGAGIMMDRNLGAISSVPDSRDFRSVTTRGLLYQWGRKDPFLGSINTSNSYYDKVETASSTAMWSSDVVSDSSTGTIEYSVSNPLTFIHGNKHNNDWYYTGSSAVDDARWTASDNEKSIYDPCPAGWRVPDGGRSNGIWAKASGVNNEMDFSHFENYPYDNNNFGMNFSGKFGGASIIWYPVSGKRNADGSYTKPGSGGYFWSASPYDNDSRYLYYAYTMACGSNGNVATHSTGSRADALSVRCQKE